MMYFYKCIFKKTAIFLNLEYEIEDNTTIYLYKKWYIFFKEILNLYQRQRILSFFILICIYA